MIDRAYSRLKMGTQIRRMCNVSNGANSVLTTAGNIHVLPLNADGPNNRAYNNPSGYGSVDLVNDWFDIRNLHIAADLTFRVTLANNAGGGSPVSGANILLRFIPNIATPGVFIDNPNADLTFRGQSMMLVMGYTDQAQAVQVCIRTISNENIRCLGVYMSVDDIVNIGSGL